MHFRRDHTKRSSRPSISSTTSSTSTSSSSYSRSSSMSTTSGITAVASAGSRATAHASGSATSSPTLSRTSTATSGEILDMESIYDMTLPLDRPVAHYYKDSSTTHFSPAKTARESNAIVRVQTPGPRRISGASDFSTTSSSSSSSSRGLKALLGHKHRHSSR